MSDYIAALLKGILEGLTEFIPVSSTGHLVLARDLEWMKLPEYLESGFDIFIQMGAILAVVIYFRQRLWFRARTVLSNPESRRFGWHLALALVPSIVVGLLCNDYVEANMMTPTVVASSLLVGGIIMLLVEWLPVKKRHDNAEALPLGIVMAIGCFQCLAIIFPGASRSGATIVGALAIGVSRTAAAEFSFFLALPTLFAATGYSILKLMAKVSLTGHDWTVLAIGFVVSFLVGWLSIDLLMRFIRKHSLVTFGFYRIIIGIFILLMPLFS